MRKLFLMSVMSLSLVGCFGGGSGGSGGGSNGGGSGSSVQGILIDSAIQGVFYETESGHGLTNANGKFVCKSGETVEFSLPASNNKRIYLGELVCRKVISPIEIVTNGAFTIDNDISELSAPQQQAVKNVLRLVQSLDSRPDIEGIQIDPDEIASLANYLEGMSVDIENDGMDGLFALDSANMTTYLNNIMTAVGRPADVVSEADALVHFAATQSACSSSGCPTSGGNNQGGGENLASISSCLKGVTFAEIVVEGDGFAGNTHYPVNTITGVVANVPVVKVETLIVLRSNSTGEVYRKKTTETNYWYRFQIPYWIDSDENGLLLSQVGYGYGQVNLRFELPSFNPAVRMSGISFGNNEAVGDDRMWDVLTANACSSQVPSTSNVTNVVTP